MNLEDINATIRELEAQLSNYDVDTESTVDQNESRRKTAPETTSRRLDSGIGTAQQTPTTLLSDEPNTSTPMGATRKSVHFGPDDVDRSYDLSQFLHRDEGRRDQDRANVTTRRRNPHELAAPPPTFHQRRDVPKIRPATYDGSSSWLDYKSHFEACAKLSQYDYTEKGLYLSVSLRGLAQGVLGNLSVDTQMDYNELVRALNDRFAPPDQMELYRIQLRERRQKASESLPELAQHIRRLTNLAYPTVPADVKETLAKDHFIDALLDSDLRLRIKQARPRSLNDAVRHSVELEAYVKAEKKIGESRGILKSVTSGPAGNTTAKLNDDKDVHKMLAELSKAVASLKTEMIGLKKKSDSRISPNAMSPRNANESWKKNVECFKCGLKGHIKRECKAKKNDRANENDKEPQISKQSQIKGKVGFNINKIEPGMFVAASIDKTEVKLLVDTGATLSIISHAVFKSLASSDTDINNLEAVNRDVLAANNEPLKTFGRTTVSISISGKIYETPVLVADVTVDGVIGLDFMKQNACKIDICNENMQLNNETIPLLVKGNIGCFKIALTDTVRIPPRSEIITKGNICLPKQVKISGEGLIEPDEKFLSSERGLVGKVLVNLNEQVPVRIMNVSPELMVVYAKTVVAKVTPVETVEDQISFASDTTNETRLSGDVQNLLERSSGNLSRKQSQEVKKLLVKYDSVFSKDDKDFGKTDIVKHRINIGSRAPIKQRLRRTPMHLEGVVEEHLDDMLKRDVIEPSTSPWASAIVLVRKKDGSTRFCVDYRKLNDATIKDAYPLPRIDETLDHLSGACWFSTLDLCSGYWQVAVEPQDRPKTAFITKRGLFQFKVMPFGLCNAPAPFERLMETILNGLQWETCFV